MILTSHRLRVAAKSTCAAILLLSLSAVQGCYYVQAARGQLAVLAAREPLDEVVADPSTPAELTARLELLSAARRFASDELRLPDNESYTTYADLERDFVVWNVIAAPEFSLQAKTWCYLIVGCVAYRGYFSADAALKLAWRLRADGYDVFVGGVAAYSTLGRFADPILNTMLRSDDADLVALLFHELAHQQLYIQDDTEFNESFATAVAEIGLRRWLEGRGGQAALVRWQHRQVLREEFSRLVQAAAADLQQLYASGQPEPVLREAKRRRLTRLTDDVAKNAEDGVGLHGELNNARLVSMTLYRGQVGAFHALFAECGQAFDCFYRRVEEIAEREPEARAAALAALHPRDAASGS